MPKAARSGAGAWSEEVTSVTVPRWRLSTCDQDTASLTASLVDVYSESGHETALTDAVEAGAARASPHLTVDRDGDAVVARTALGARRAGGAGRAPRHRAARRQPAVAAGRGHPVRPGHGRHEGRGRRHAAAGRVRLGVRPRDITYVFYDGEEVEAERNGLLRLSAHAARTG